MLYDPQGVRAYFDNYGTREWERLERTLQGRESTPYIGVFWMNMYRKAFKCWTWAAALGVSLWKWHCATGQDLLMPA